MTAQPVVWIVARFLGEYTPIKVVGADDVARVLAEPSRYTVVDDPTATPEPETLPASVSDPAQGAHASEAGANGGTATRMPVERAEKVKRPPARGKRGK